MRIEIEVENVEQISLSIDAILNAINGNRPRPVDFAPLIGVRGILLQISEKVPNSAGSSGPVGLKTGSN